MRILIVGGTRMMGRHLTRALLREGHEVTLANRGQTPDDFGETIQRVRMNRLDEASIRGSLDNTCFDLVYDSLAYCTGDVRRLLPYIGDARYIQTSSASVYDLTNAVREDDFDPRIYPVHDCERSGVTYAEGKRQAEAAVSQEFPETRAVWVRFPYVIGEDDYTGRLRFYVEHMMRGLTISCANPIAAGSFIDSGDAGNFLAFLANQSFVGPINAACEGVISIAGICSYITTRTGIEPVFSAKGEPSPYEFSTDYHLDTSQAQSIGYTFPPLEIRLHEILDRMIATHKEGQ